MTMIDRLVEAARRSRVECYGSDEDIVRAVLEALREPTSLVTDAMSGENTERYRSEGYDEDEMWKAAIDAILSESCTPEPPSS